MSVFLKLRNLHVELCNPATSGVVLFGYTFPAIRGIQAQREYFVSMCPLRLIPRIFSFNEEELPPELRAQRILNKGRIPEMARYLVDNRSDYVFSALTASIDGEVKFEPFGKEGDPHRLGSLHISMEAKFIINDGQHRRAAIESAIRENPDIADETIAVVFFMDAGLERCQQMFADLNRHAIRPSTSLGVLYDHRDDGARLVKISILKIPLFKELTEMERSTLVTRSKKLFTLSALYSATNALLHKIEDKTIDELKTFCVSYWTEVAKQFPAWQQVQKNKLNASEIRRDFIHSHGIVLQALGRVGNVLLRDKPDDWKDLLTKLPKINWSRNNSKLWEGRATIGGRVSKNSNNVILTTNAIKKHLGLELTPEEQGFEDAFKQGSHGPN